MSATVGFLILFCVLFIGVAFGINLASVSECLDEEVTRSNFQKKTKQPFHLHFGDAVVELFNVLSKHDIKRIKSLAHCVAKDDPEFLEDFTTSQLFGPDKNLGVGNITHLTGIVPLLLPDIINKVSLAFSGVYKELEWGSYYAGEELGVRSCRIVSNRGEGKTISRAAIQKLWQKQEEDKKNFVLNPRDPNYKDDAYDEDADENIKKFLKKDMESKFILIASLTDRAKYAGGTVVVDRKDEETVEHADVYDQDADELDEDDEVFVPTPRKHFKYNALTSKYGRYQPEKGNVLVVRSDHVHGIQMLKKGYRELLVCELWRYQDAPVPSSRTSIKHRLSVAEAKPFTKKTSTELRRN